MTIPTVEDFTSATITDNFDDMISPPGLTNHWATVQVDHDVLAVRSLNVPPVGQGDSVSGRLYIDGRLAESYGQPVEVSWRPDQVRRRTEIDGVIVETVTVCPPGVAGVAVLITATGRLDGRRLGLWLDSTVNLPSGPWLQAEPPRQQNSLSRNGTVRRGVPEDRSAVSLQTLTDGAGADVADVSESERIIEVEVAGDQWAGAYLHVIAADDEAADTQLARLRETLEGAAADSTRAWNEELRAIFTPGNDLYGGSLPRLETSNKALRDLYWWGALGTIWFRRDNPASVLGRSYDTLMPRYWQTTTFLWDYSLSSLVHALLDPQVMRRQVGHWVGLDINKHFGTEWLTGGPVGYWYSVNQYAMVRMVSDFVRITGDDSFLAEEFAGPDGTPRPLVEHLREWSLAWLEKRTDSGLADYGGIDNLLECVSSYVHEVASLQAANAWSMRTVADILDQRDRGAEAAELRGLAEEVVTLLGGRYRAGEGVFNTRHADGRLVATRHCYDFATVGTTIAADLGEEQRREMVHFFDTELRSPSWLRALSPSDADAGFSVRPDHQWNGAYPAWPADAARAAIALGGADVVADWLPGLARTTRQGPPGQAHFVEEAAGTIDGGARKAPGQLPYLIDWACSSAGAWCELVIASIFGVEVSVNGSIRVDGVLDRFDPEARLEGLVIRGTTFSIDRTGAHAGG